MVANSEDIQKGMEVFDSNNTRFGSVAEVFSDGSAGSGTTTNWARSGGGPGALGDEGRVAGEGRGSGTLGDESRVVESPGREGGPGTLGDESRVGSEYGATGSTDSRLSETLGSRREENPEVDVLIV
jgi:hypothetical protein